MKRINLNDHVKVKLTPLGKEIYYERELALNKKYGAEVIHPSYPTVDYDGFSEFQLWDFISIYGNHIGLGLPPVLEDIHLYFEDKDVDIAFIRPYDLEDKK